MEIPLNEDGSVDQEAIVETLSKINETSDQTKNVEPVFVEEAISEPPIPEPVIQEAPKEVKEEVNPKDKKQNVTIDSDVSYSDTWDPEADTIVLPSSFDNEIRETVENLPKVNLLNDPETRNWAQTVSEGLGFATFNETFTSTLEEQGSDFHQTVDVNNQFLAGSQPKFRSIENQTLAGERATIRLMSHLGLGTLFQVPLWHTGIWITFKAPNESEIIELNRRLISDKIELGRSTYGLVFSNTSSYTTDRIVDFAINHIYDSTLSLNEVPVTELKSIIDCQDIPSLIWGFVCTMYPKGFQFRRACISDPEKCNHIVEAMLNVSKLQWTNRAALTDWQKTHMSVRRSNSKDKASILRYKEEMKKTQKRRILFNKEEDSEIAIILKTPSIADYVDAGHRWISELVELVDKTLGLEVRDQERNTFIMRHGQASSMRQYVHWVDSIEMGSNTISDSESIESCFNTLSSHNSIRTEFINEVIKFINESTIAVIGIPVYDCPKCKAGQEDKTVDLPNHKNIIPLDVVQLFFALLTQRLSKISER